MPRCLLPSVVQVHGDCHSLVVGVRYAIDKKSILVRRFSFRRGMNQSWFRISQLAWQYVPCCGNTCTPHRGIGTCQGDDGLHRSGSKTLWTSLIHPAGFRLQTSLLADWVASADVEVNGEVGVLCRVAASAAADVLNFFFGSSAKSATWRPHLPRATPTHPECTEITTHSNWRVSYNLGYTRHSLLPHFTQYCLHSQVQTQKWL